MPSDHLFTKSHRCLLIAVALSFATQVIAEPPQTQSAKTTEKQAKAKSTGKDSAKGKSAKKPAPFSWVNPLPKKFQLPSLKHATFSSQLAGTEVGYAILLPPSYESSGDSRRYSVVYYLHGGRPGSEAKSVQLSSHMHDAMKSGDVDDMIYVFVNGGPVSHYNVPDQPGAIGANVFIKELIPHIDATYRTIADREHRGLEGFSQGGRGTMRLSLRYPELFSSAAAGGGGYATEKKISESGGHESETLRFAEGDNVWDLARAYVAANKPPVRWMIYVGTKGFNYENNLEYMEFLESLKIPHKKIIVPDVPHSGGKIYEQRGVDIMQFHAANFRAAN